MQATPSEDRKTHKPTQNVNSVTSLKTTRTENSVFETTENPKVFGFGVTAVTITVIDTLLKHFLYFIIIIVLQLLARFIISTNAKIAKAFGLILKVSTEFETLGGIIVLMFQLFTSICGFRMMAEDLGVTDDVVTKFLLKTTRLCPRITEHTITAALHCGKIATDNPPDDEAVVVPMTTGSVEPMMPCFGDVNVMYHCIHWSTQLAIPQGLSPPTQLPAVFHNYVKVYEILGYHFPGYVYLRLRTLLADSMQ